MSDVGDDKISKSLSKSDYYIFYLLFHMKDFPHLLGKANLKKNSLLVRTISIAYMIPSQRLFVFNLTFIDAVLGRSFEE